jgi:hypothetical protein
VLWCGQWSPSVVAATRGTVMPRAPGNLCPSRPVALARQHLASDVTRTQPQRRHIYLYQQRRATTTLFSRKEFLDKEKFVLDLHFGR